MEDGGTPPAFILTSFGIVRGVLLFNTGLSFDKLPFCCPVTGTDDEGFPSPPAASCLSLRCCDVVRGWAVNEMPSHGGLSCPLLPVSSLDTC